jgi:CRISPR system Cascade subunit CasE
MYLSKIEFSPAHLDEMVKILAKGLFHEHQMIWNILPEDKSIGRDFIYRREDSRGLPFYYLLSVRRPDDISPNFTVQSQRFTPQLKQGDLLQFSLRANAVKTTKIDDTSKKRKRRDIIEARADEYKKQYPDSKDRPPVAIIHHEAGEDWLKKQGVRCGFQVNNLIVENHQFHKVRKPKDPNLRQFASIDFHGQIKVTDPQQFIDTALFFGLGRSKAFGCGLMLIRRV